HPRRRHLRPATPRPPYAVPMGAMGVVGSLQFYIALLLGLAALAMEVFALVAALRHRAEEFTAAGKLTKQIWTLILVVAVAIGFVTATNPLGIGILPVVAAAVHPDVWQNGI